MVHYGLSENGECEWNSVVWPFKQNPFSSASIWYYIYLVCILTQSVDEILWCYHSNETISAVVSHVTIYLVCSSNLWVCMKFDGVATQMVPFLYCNSWKICITWVSVCWHLRAKTIWNYSRGMPSAQGLQTPKFKCYRFWLANELTKSDFFVVNVTFDWPIYAWAAPLKFVALENYLPLFFHLAPFRLIVLHLSF